MKAFRMLLIFLAPWILIHDSSLARGGTGTINPWEENPHYALAWKASQLAVEKLGKGKDGTLLVLTNAGFAKTDGADSTPALEAISEVTESSPGKGNLWVIQSAPDRPLYFFYYRRRNGDSFFAEADGKAFRGLRNLSFREILAKETAQVFRHTVSKNIGLTGLTAHPEATEKEIQGMANGNFWASRAALAHLWELNPPVELVRAVQFHDHICPGVLSGYYLARFLSAEFPLEQNQRYFFIASPAYCKDDALQVIFNQTVGKRGMAVLPLSEEDRARLLPHSRDASGIFFRYDPKTGRGNGAVLGFAWDRLRRDSTSETDKRFPFLNSLRQIRWMVEEREHSGRYVSFLKTFDLKPGEVPQDYARPGVNPWEKLGLWKEGGKGEKR